MSSQSRSLVAPFVAVLIGALALLLAGFWILSQARLNSERIELRDSRFRFSLGVVRVGLEGGLRLGFTPSEIPLAPALLEQARSREKDILSVDVFDPSGRILFTTDQGGLGAKVPATWRDQCLATPPSEVWTAKDDDDRLQCAVVLDALDVKAAGVLLRYRLERYDWFFGASPRDIGWFVIALATFTALGGLSGWLLVRPLERRILKAADAVIGEVVAGDDAVVGPVGTAMRAVVDFEAAVSTVEAEADSLDHIDAR
jgi:hypothetical protein